jgi:hypothetical protein
MLRKTLKFVATLLVVAMLGIVAAWPAQAADPYAAATPQSGAIPSAGALDKAAKDNKYLFVFFSDGQDATTAAMKASFQAAMTKLADRASSIAVNIADPVEKGIVEKFKVRGAPMPLVLAIAPTGAATRAFPKTFTEAQLQAAFVSPCTAKCMKAIQDRHSILLCVQNNKTQANQAALQGAATFQADPQYTKGTEIIVLNPADQAEQGFLKDLQVDPQTPTAVTLLVTPPGAPVARFVGAVSKAQIEAAVRAAQTSCGPGCSCHH